MIRPRLPDVPATIVAGRVLASSSGSAKQRSMGFRFRKTFTILPGVRINLSKSGFSTSIGRPGATLNVGRRGPRATMGIPGSGLSYDRALPGGGALRGLRGLGCAAVVAGGALALAMCQGGSTTGSPRAAGQGAIGGDRAATRTAHVTASSANCRTTPAAGAPVATTLAHGRGVIVGEARGGWVRVAAGATSCWVSDRLLGDAPTPHTAVPLSRPPATRDVAPGAAQVSDCPCGSGRQCTGPRGGRYCLTSSGRKRY